MAIEAFGPSLVDGDEVFGPNLLPLVVIGEVFGPMFIDGAELFGPIVDTPGSPPDILETSSVVVLPVISRVLILRRV